MGSPPMGAINVGAVGKTAFFDMSKWLEKLHDKVKTSN